MKHPVVHDWQVGGFGLYVHWPFCESKCPYCDFNSHVPASVDQDQWLEAYRLEIGRLGRETSGRVLKSVFFGGGTPSLMSPETVGGILEAAGTVWTLANDCEVTLEANPGSVEAQRFSGYAAAGVNRISMGFQSLDDGALRLLGRRHTVAESMAALEVASRLFSRVSFDLIYARQHQSLEEWRRELERALSFGTEHLSLYQLTIEDGTPFAWRRNAGKLHGLPPEDLAADMFELTQDMCEAAGLPAYEVSNHARSGGESRHNLIYWSAGDYVGIGPGAHGRLTLDGRRHATTCYRQPGEWLASAQRGDGENQRVLLSSAEQADEYLIMGLRTSSGLDLHRLERMSGARISSDIINHLCEAGLVVLSGHILMATRQGRLLLDAIIRELATGLVFSD